MGHSDSTLQFVPRVADFVSQHTKIDSQTAMQYGINYALLSAGASLTLADDGKMSLFHGWAREISRSTLFPMSESKIRCPVCCL